MDLFKDLLDWVKDSPLRAALWTVFVAVMLVVWVKYGARIKAFIIETRIELGKCVWPVDPQERGFARYHGLVQSTAVVVFASVMLGAYIALSDLALSFIIKDFILKIGN